MLNRQINGKLLGILLFRFDSVSAYFASTLTCLCIRVELVLQVLMFGKKPTLEGFGVSRRKTPGFLKCAKSGFEVCVGTFLGLHYYKLF